MSELELEGFEGVARVVPILKPYKLASREFRPRGTVVNCGGVKIGGQRLVVMAGPCAVESESQVLAIAEKVKSAGAHLFRGGAFKPRT